MFVLCSRCTGGASSACRASGDSSEGRRGLNRESVTFGFVDLRMGVILISHPHQDPSGAAPDVSEPLKAPARNPGEGALQPVQPG